MQMNTCSYQGREERGKMCPAGFGGSGGAGVRGHRSGALAGPGRRALVTFWSVLPTRSWNGHLLHRVLLIGQPGAWHLPGVFLASVTSWGKGLHDIGHQPASPPDLDAGLRATRGSFQNSVPSQVIGNYISL